MLNDQDLQTFMDANQVAGEIVRLTVPTPTVETAADAVNVLPGQIVKSVLFLVNGETPVMAVACGLNLIDRRAIAERYAVGRKRIKLADAETVLRITGYQAGSVPPFGHLQQLPTLLDECIRSYPEVYAGGGTLSALMRITPNEIERITGGTWINMLQNP